MTTWTKVSSPTLHHSHEKSKSCYLQVSPVFVAFQTVTTASSVGIPNTTVVVAPTYDTKSLAFSYNLL